MSYPPAPLDGRSDSSPATPGSHAADHTAERDAINAIVAELGENPSGTHSTVEARLAAIEAALAAGGGTGGGGTGGGSGTTDPVQPPSAAVPVSGYPLDITSWAGASTRDVGGWTRGDFRYAGLYQDTIIIPETSGSSLAPRAYNAANPLQYVDLATGDNGLGGGITAWAQNASGVIFLMRNTSGVATYENGTWAFRAGGVRGSWGFASGYYWSVRALAFGGSAQLVRVGVGANTVEELATVDFLNGQLGFAVSGSRIWVARVKSSVGTTFTAELLSTSADAPGTWTLSASYTVQAQSQSIGEWRSRLGLGSAGGGNALVLRNSSSSPSAPAASLTADVLSPGGEVIGTTTLQLPAAPVYWSGNAGVIYLTPHPDGRNLLSFSNVYGGPLSHLVLTSGGVLDLNLPSNTTLPMWGPGQNASKINYAIQASGQPLTLHQIALQA